MKTLIGIATLNGPDRLQRCLGSILSCTDLSDAQVLVADDGSTDENLKLNKDAVHNAGHGIEMLHGHGRTGIARTWNRLVRHTGTPLVVLLNDDIEVVPDWLEVLIYSLENNPQAGMVGLNCYSGLTKDQCKGQLVLRPDYVEAALERPRLLDGGGGLVSSFGPAFAFRREAWNRAGAFDERYFCFYEEVDFGVALARLGYVNYIASYPVVFHQGGATNSDPANLDAARHMAESQAKFEEKWGKTIGELRDELASRADLPRPREWNQQVKVWP